MTDLHVEWVRLDTLARRIDRALDRDDRRAFMALTLEWLRVKRVLGLL